jgi:hypothetical protein
MFRTLLYICVSLLALAGYSQQTLPDVASPSEVVTEDPNKTVADLNSSVNNSRVTLSWTVNGELPDFFTIERSNNGKNFETVTVLNNLEKKLKYQWTDDAPKTGRSFYRIKYSFGSGPDLYSSTVTVAIAGYIDYKFYPNPVDHILIVRSDMPIDVQISDANGKVRITESRVRGIHTINVSSLEKGIYLIRFSNKLTNVMSQDKLIKN